MKYISKSYSINIITIKIMSDMQAQRSTILQETDLMGSRRRFGLFSSPISTAVGDDGQYRTIQHPKDSQGKPVTQLRNIVTNPPRSGQLNKSYFSAINSLATSPIKDQYMDPDKKRLQIENESFRNGYKKQQMFKPASGFKEIHLPSYQFKQQNNPEINPKRNRNSDGKVTIQPRNFYSNQQTTVLTSYFKPLKHMDDPYERSHQIQSEFQKKEKSLEGQAPFKLNLHPRDVLNKQKAIYGTDVTFPEKKVREPKLNIYKHETDWKSSNTSRSGIYGYFMPIIYKEDPPKERSPRIVNQQNKKDPFKRMSIAQSKPSPSILFHRNNLIRTISHSVSHHS